MLVKSSSASGLMSSASVSRTRSIEGVRSEYSSALSQSLSKRSFAAPTKSDSSLTRPATCVPASTIATTRSSVTSSAFSGPSSTVRPW